MLIGVDACHVMGSGSARPLSSASFVGEGEVSLVGTTRKSMKDLVSMPQGYSNHLLEIDPSLSLSNGQEALQRHRITCGVLGLLLYLCDAWSSRSSR